MYCKKRKLHLILFALMLLFTACGGNSDSSIAKNVKTVYIHQSDKTTPVSSDDPAYQQILSKTQNAIQNISATYKAIPQTSEMLESGLSISIELSEVILVKDIKVQKIVIPLTGKRFETDHVIAFEISNSTVCNLFKTDSSDLSEIKKLTESYLQRR